MIKQQECILSCHRNLDVKPYLFIIVQAIEEKLERALSIISKKETYQVM